MAALVLSSSPSFCSGEIKIGRYSDTCFARVGLMGNPSDGFEGKTLSFLLENFHAEVCVDVSSEFSGIELTESLKLPSMSALHHHTMAYGYAHGLKLIQATCKVFFERTKAAGISTDSPYGLKITYSTNIPRMVGLSGSSAIVVACFRALMKAYDLNLSCLAITEDAFPEIIMSIETVELGISAGLQDRVVQTYGGLVHMDFTRSDSRARNIYTKLDVKLLPKLYIAYALHMGGDSGRVHSTVKQRWSERDGELVRGMMRLGQLADEAVGCLMAHATGAAGTAQLQRLATLMDENFATRRSLYGDEVVGKNLIEVAQLLKSCGFAAKFTGSGGAFVCLANNGEDNWKPPVIEAAVREKLANLGFAFEKIQIPDM